MIFKSNLLILPTTAHLNQDSHIVEQKFKKKQYPLFVSARIRLYAFFVLKMTSDSEESCPVVVLHTVFTPAVGNPDGFKGLGGLDLTCLDVRPSLCLLAGWHKLGSLVLGVP